MGGAVMREPGLVYHVSLMVTPEEGRRLKLLALERGLTMQALMREAIAPLLGEPAEPKTRRGSQANRQPSTA
jgi:hypothetical protein